MSYNNEVVFIQTPQGHNEFYRLYGEMIKDLEDCSGTPIELAVSNPKELTATEVKMRMEEYGTYRS